VHGRARDGQHQRHVDDSKTVDCEVVKESVTKNHIQILGNDSKYGKTRDNEESLFEETNVGKSSIASHTCLIKVRREQLFEKIRMIRSFPDKMTA
jgi:hypothetical protein